MTEQKLRVAVLFGGRSSEHAISCLSASAVLKFLDPARYDVIAVGITRDGGWVLGPQDPQALTAPAGELPGVDPSTGALALPGDPTRRGLIRLEAGREGEVLTDIDVVFPVLHGAFGEDGTVQGLLELAGVPYVGAGVLASAVGMDKGFTRTLLAAAGLPVGDFVALDRSAKTLTDEERERLGLPVFVKPARGGSSIGVTKVTTWDDLDAAIAGARTHDPKVVIEAGVEGREVECGVLEFPDGSLRASVPAEIHMGTGVDFYDFRAKYLDDTCAFTVPADLDPETTARLRTTAVEAFRAVDCQGLARVDFFVEPDGALKINEINTMPGFTPISMYPQMWNASGIDYPTLLTTLLDTAIARGTGLR